MLEPDLTIDVPLIPPSENKIKVIRVIRGKVGGIAYTKEAENFRKAFKDWIRTHHLVPIQHLANKHTDMSVYDIHLTLWFHKSSLVNKGYPKTKTFYKRMDVGNRRKLLEDCLAEVLGIDDMVYFKLTMEKRQTPDDIPEGVSIDITQHENGERYGIKEPDK